jgi:hypothetical protein
MISTSIAQRLTDELRRRAGQGADRVEVVGDGVTVQVDIEASERYAVGVRGFAVAPPAPIVDVRETAEHVVERVRALDEPLQLVEHDAREGRAVVRSASPERDAAGVSYWEADIRVDGASLRRYRKDHTAYDRELITEPLPHAVAGNIAEQLVEAIRSEQ